MVWTLIAAAAEYLVAATGMSLAAATFAVNFAVSYVVTRAFADNPEKQQDMGVRQQVPPSAVNALPVVYGDAYMGGTFIDAVLTTDQKCMYYVLAISSISPNGQFTFDTTEMYYGDRLITFSTTDPARVESLSDEASPPNVDDKIDGCLYIGLYTSNSAGVITPVNWYAPSYVMAENFAGFSIPPEQVWPASGRQMYNTAFAIVRLEYSREAGTTQLQPITFHVSHTLNNTGVAKPGDVWYDYMTNSVYGGAVSAEFVNSSSASVLNAYSDQLITFTGSDGLPKTQNRYRVNGVLDAGQSVLSNVDRIVSSCDSWMTYNAALGQWSVVVNKAESASYAFNDNNIIGDIRVSATDITSSINQVEARFPFKENRDQAAFISIKTPDVLLYPNEPVNKYSITYDLVNESVQAHYLANRLLEQAREDLIVSFSTTYFGIQVDAGNIVSVTNSDYGWNAKLFRVMKVNEASLPDGSLGAHLELYEYNDQVYDDKDITQFTPVPNSGLSSAAYFSALTKPIVTSTSPDSSIPNFNVEVYIPLIGRVMGVKLYYTKVETPIGTDWQLFQQASSIDSTPFTKNSTYTFENLVLPTGADITQTYYFAYVVYNETANSAKSPISDPFTWTPSATAGPFVDISGFTSFSKSTGGLFTPSSATLTAITENITNPTYAWFITGATPTTGSLIDIVITPDSSATSVVAELAVGGDNLTAPIVRSVTMAIITQGTSANKYATAYLYQWNTITPSNPNGTSTYTWATGLGSAYTGTNGWQATAPANPGTPLVRLYVASKQVTDVATSATTTVSWASGFGITDASQNGANGVQNATPTVYQWAISIPTISGTSTYTWASGTFTPTPSGWTTGITTAPSPGFTLWAARVPLTEAATVSLTTINWTTASIVAAGYSGTNGGTGTAGASARICYSKTTLGSLASTPTTITTTGSTSFPPNGSWGSDTVWQATSPSIVANESVYQSDGVYNPATGNTIWNVPYLSTLKVGNLAAISTNTGNLTVTGTFQSSTAAISGTTMTGSGGVLYSSGAFSYGNTTGNITYNGTNLYFNGTVFAEAITFKAPGDVRGNVAVLGFNNVMTVSRTGATLLPAFYVYDSSSTTTAMPALTVLDTASSISQNLATFSGYASGGITMNVSSNGSSSGAAKFFNNNSSKQFWAAPGLYSAYSPSGGGKIYIVDGNGPFTGFHDTLIPIDDVVEIGDIVVDTQLIYKDGISSTLFEVAVSSQPNQQAAIGVASGIVPVMEGTPAALWVSTSVQGEFSTASEWQIQPGFDAAVMESTYKVVQVNALGEGQINVCGENGDIAVGDYIVTSSMAGKGMKQADDLIHSYTVAKARETATFSSPTDVQMIACIYVSG